ncbi:MAG: hypothetical protein JWP87_2361 [Labilithrix sp.]|jgi:hypothetical protein|nr:hypothetical protein [Labilithrix sp.]
MTRKSVIAAALFGICLFFSQKGNADEPGRPAEAGPLPSKDIRWSLVLAGGTDVGTLPRATPKLALGFDVRRGALAFRLEGTALLPQQDHPSAASVASFDTMGMICALLPVATILDAGACGGIGAGMLRSDAATMFRPQGLGVVRVDFVLFPGFLLSADAGALLDPMRTEVALGAPGETHRASLVAFRGSLGAIVRLW